MSILNLNPFPFVPDVNGDPLQDGYIYIGLPNTDPQANPKTVYWDAASLFPVAQPLRTVNGRIYNAGNMAQVFVTGAYSIRCLDKNGGQVFVAMSVTGF